MGLPASGLNQYLARTQHRDAGEGRTGAPPSRVKHSTTEPL